MHDSAIHGVMYLSPFRTNCRDHSAAKLLGMFQPLSILDGLMAQPTGLHFPRLELNAVSNTDTTFSISLDFSTFKPEEVKIWTTGDQITITAGHVETDKNCAHVSRHVTHIYRLPKDVDPKTIKSTLNTEGVLSIKAEKRAIEPQETEIAVEHQSE